MDVNDINDYLQRAHEIIGERSPGEIEYDNAVVANLSAGMSIALKIGLLSCCLLAVVGILALRSFWRDSLESVSVVLVGQTTNEAKLRCAQLEITNRGPYRIYLPDSCSVQTRATSKWVYVHTSDIWVEPQKATCISVPVPGSSHEWRVSAGYVVENPLNRSKTRLGASHLAPKLPGGLVSVQSKVVLSLWIAP